MHRFYSPDNLHHIQSSYLTNYRSTANLIHMKSLQKLHFDHHYKQYNIQNNKSKEYLRRYEDNHNNYHNSNNNLNNNKKKNCNINENKVNPNSNNINTQKKENFSSIPSPFPQKKIGKYQYNPNNLLGQGFSSKVYKASNTQTFELFAIKVIDLKKMSLTSLQMLQDQINIMKQLNHPNVIKCYDIYKSKSNCYIVMEYCDGGTMMDLIAQNKQIRKALKKENKGDHLNNSNNFTQLQQTILQQISQVTQGLKYLHSNNVLHRDIKPANILKKKNEWKIADLGFSIKCSKQTKTKVNVGTPLYMPLQSLKYNIYSFQSDIFSIGIILFELLLGVTPWQSKSQKQLIKKMQNISIQQICSKNNISSQMSNILIRICNMDRKYRMDKDQFNRLNLVVENSMNININNINNINNKIQQEQQKTIQLLGKNIKHCNSNISINLNLNNNIVLNPEKQNLQILCNNRQKQGQMIKIENMDKITYNNNNDNNTNNNTNNKNNNNNKINKSLQNKIQNLPRTKSTSQLALNIPNLNSPSAHIISYDNKNYHNDKRSNKPIKQIQKNKSVQYILQDKKLTNKNINDNININKSNDLNSMKRVSSTNNIQIKTQQAHKYKSNMYKLTLELAFVNRKNIPQLYLAHSSEIVANYQNQQAKLIKQNILNSIKKQQSKQIKYTKQTQQINPLTMSPIITPYHSAIFTTNNHIIINHIHFCRFLYYFYLNIDYILIDRQQKQQLIIIIFQYIFKIINQLNNLNLQNTINIKQWRQYIKTQKYLDIKSTIYQYKERYQKEFKQWNSKFKQKIKSQFESESLSSIKIIGSINNIGNNANNISKANNCNDNDNNINQSIQQTKHSNSSSINISILSQLKQLLKQCNQNLKLTISSLYLSTKKSSSSIQQIDKNQHSLLSSSLISSLPSQSLKFILSNIEGLKNFQQLYKLIALHIQCEQKLQIFQEKSKIKINKDFRKNINITIRDYQKIDLQVMML